MILAAGQGTRLQPLTNNKPKCLTPILNKPIIEWQIETAHAANIRDIIVVGGYKIEQLEKYPITLICNENFMTTNMVYSLLCAKDHFNDDIIISYGDIIYTNQILQKLISSSHDLAITIDLLWQSYWEQRFEDPLSDAESLELFYDGRIKEIGQKAQNISDIQGQYIGLCLFRKKAIHSLLQTYNDLSENDTKLNGRSAGNYFMTDLLQEMIRRNIALHSFPINRGWYEIDSLSDLAVAEASLQKNNILQHESNF
ncbi:phosphocholine cytidylyltransferase family protein [Candidatus Berkiella cookevillensis]|uniref:Phosphocholine cytidylyltransferase family protein n=1 Tax=Candidatus Berkiella cookevillensis TaxID=437022 RepID=A0AAE3HPF0_9GAMM|nr:phosphocholine cytidylyltransferase family protein [Candidatus Berkiella cookevillensis]